MKSDPDATCEIKAMHHLHSYISILLFSFILGLSCQHPKIQYTDYPFTPKALSIRLHSLLKMNEMTRREALKDHLFTEAQLQSLLISPHKDALIEEYSTRMAPAFIAEAPTVMTEMLDHGANDWSLIRVGPKGGSAISPGALDLLEAIPNRLPLYTVRLSPRGESIGLRMGEWVFFEGQWRTTLKLSELLLRWSNHEK